MCAPGMGNILEGLTEKEVGIYVKSHLEAAEAPREIFTEGALKVLHEFSGGVARKVNKVALGALMFAHAWKRPSPNISVFEYKHLSPRQFKRGDSLFEKWSNERVTLQRFLFSHVDRRFFHTNPSFLDLRTSLQGRARTLNANWVENEQP
ncbi:MAG: hypothetical protein LBS00_05100 [Synergistaceae bacterium]|jgi:hypothetical protein|nr:hypothetical protein [Synergistaceae bacterium]